MASIVTRAGVEFEEIRQNIFIPSDKTDSACNSDVKILIERFSDLFAVVLLALIGVWSHHHADFVVMGTLAFIILILIAIPKNHKYYN